MLPVIPKPPISRAQKRMALAIAGTVDLLQVGLFPLLGLGYVLDDALDFFAAIALMAVCGFKWQFVLAFLMELVPVLDILPTWTAVVMLMPATDEGKVAPSAGPQRLQVTSVRVQEDSYADKERAEDEVEGVVVPPVQGPPKR